MNAPTSAASLAKPSLQLVDVAFLVPSKSHVQELRRARFSTESLDKLAADIKRNGLLQHPLARPIEKGRYEIVAGERRWLAARRAGLEEIYVNVRELNDDQALEAQLSENLQREDLHELEEAEGYEELMKLKKISADQVAELIDQSRSYVYARLKLIALCPEARKAFYAGEIDASNALLIARIGHHDTQRQALKDLTKGDRGQGPMTYREAHRHVLQFYMLNLSKAVFDIKDATLLPRAGDCIKCPKRTGNQADLFGDVKSADVCTDPKCFDDKRQAHFAGARKKLEAAGRKVIYGAEAKKLLPHWDDKYGGNDYIKGEYVLLTASEYVGGRYQAVANVLGKDYVPTLIQHPGSGKIIEVAPRSTVASKASAASKERQKNRPTRTAQPSGPSKYEIDREVTTKVGERVFKDLGDKVKTVGKTELIELIDGLAPWIDHKVVGAIFGWKTNSLSALVKQARGASADKLLRVLYFTWLREKWEDGGLEGQHVLKRHKIDATAIEKEVRLELTPKQERAAAKKKAKGRKK